MAEVPAPSTITEILRRHGRLAPPSPPPQPLVRFEHPEPNRLWQMDFMGHWALAGGGRVSPWDLLDDHSRYALALVACDNQQWPTVQAWLTAVFREYGLPDAILCDHGRPWGTAGAGGISRLAAWLLRLGVEPWHGRPYHPQTQGKIERFHRTLARDLPPRATLTTLVETQVAFDAFRRISNHERPHEALGYATPASRYRPSTRPFPEAPPPMVDDAGSLVKTVTVHGSISWQGRRRYVSRGLVGEPVALVPTDDPAVWQVRYGTWRVATIDLRVPDAVSPLTPNGRHLSSQSAHCGRDDNSPATASVAAPSASTVVIASSVASPMDSAQPPAQATVNCAVVSCAVARFSARANCASLAIVPAPRLTR